MARRRKRQDEAEEIEMNLTPMLDVVFNLIIFFMIVTDMTQKELEQLVLPKASEAIKDEGDDIKKRLIINIMEDGEVIISRNSYDLDELRTALYNFAEAHRDDEGLCDEPVLVRADYLCPFEHVQSVMQRCADQNIKIWKIQLAAAQIEAEDQP